MLSMLESFVSVFSSTKQLYPTAFFFQSRFSDRAREQHQNIIYIIYITTSKR